MGLAKPPVDSISGLSPTISVDQHLTNHSPRSTVGTATEVYTYLRVLFARLGHRPCPACGKTSRPPSTRPAPTGRVKPARTTMLSATEATFPCPHCGAPLPQLGMAHFSFNKPDGACPTCTGLGMSIRPTSNGWWTSKRASRPAPLPVGTLLTSITISAILAAAAAHYGFDFDLSLPVKDLHPPQRDLLFFGVDSPRFRRHFPTVEPPTTVRQGRFEGIATSLLRRYAEHLDQHIQEADYRDKLEDFLVTQTCPDCDGTRLRPESRLVTVNGQTIIALCAPAARPSLAPG